MAGIINLCSVVATTTAIVGQQPTSTRKVEETGGTKDEKKGCKENSNRNLIIQFFFIRCFLILRKKLYCKNSTLIFSNPNLNSKTRVAIRAKILIAKIRKQVRSGIETVVKIVAVVGGGGGEIKAE